jgi:hypothetical protein
MERRMKAPGKLYAGLFLVALSTLAIEIALTRLLSVVTWYHLAFFAISIAMLGMTTGSVTVYMKPAWFAGRGLSKSLAAASLAFAASTPIAVIFLCLVPIRLNFTIMNVIGFLFLSVACALPFYFSGVVVSAALTRSDLPTGKVYAADLVGASLGCLLVLAGLEVMDAPSLIILCGALGAGASLLFVEGREDSHAQVTAVVFFAALVLAAVANAASPGGLRPVYAKGTYQSPASVVLERWNSFSRVTVAQPRQGAPFFWGKSPLAPTDLVSNEHMLKIDGEAGTPLTHFADLDDIRHLAYDVTNIAYALRPTGGACVIGVGGGRDLQAAVLYGHRTVVGVELNPIFIDLLTRRFRGYAGLADWPGVTFVVDEGRSYLSRAPAKYTVLQMSLIDTWAATGAGAFSLSENALYTVEAWRVFLGRLKSDGIFTVSRWYDPENLGEAGRLLALAVAAVLETGRGDPSRHIALVTASGRGVATLLVSADPFTKSDVDTLIATASRRGFEVPVLPGMTPANGVLARITAARSLQALQDSVRSEPMNLYPPTDESPYFFNLLRLTDLGIAWKSKGGVLFGNQIATMVLLVLIVILLVLCLATIAAPLWWTRHHRHAGGVMKAGAVYFSLLGAGFMFLEIGFMQRLSVFLGHPIYALGILLFTVILSAGAGSYLSIWYNPHTRKTLLLLPVVMVAVIVFEHVGLMRVTTTMITVPLIHKILLSIGLIIPAGMLMGMFFPTGMRLSNARGGGDTPWFWALNGIFGVLSSVLGVFFAIYIGISFNFVVAAICYGGLGLCLPQMAEPEGAQGFGTPDGR